MPAARHFPESLTRHSYWLAAAVPWLMPLAWSLRDEGFFAVWFSWLPLIVLFVAIPLLDGLIGRDLHSPARRHGRFYPDTVIPLAAAAGFLFVLAWALSVAAHVLERQGVIALAGWALSLGSIGGAIGINVAHELIHRRKRWLRGLGGLLLASVGYPGFKLEHPRWHHVHVATPRDPSSAAAGQSVYRQVPRALWANTRRAWRLGASPSVRGSGRGAINEMAAWWSVSVALTLGAALLWGWLAALIMVVQGVIAAALLEVINYVEHYGLRRAERADGRYEPPGFRHSWDCNYWLSNAILIQLPRHADHHTHPGREFSALQMHAEAPLLPLGYPTLVVAALLPPVWRRVIHPCLPARYRDFGPRAG